MNLFHLLQARAAAGKPVRVALIELLEPVTEPDVAVTDTAE